MRMAIFTLYVFLSISQLLQCQLDKQCQASAQRDECTVMSTDDIVNVYISDKISF